MITRDPEKAGGMPCVRETRIPLVTVRNMLDGGMTDREILDAYPDLTAADLDAVRLLADAARPVEAA